MTKKDYILIAEVIKSQNDEQFKNPDVAGSDRIIMLGIEMAIRLGKDNERFDRARFLEACGIEQTEHEIEHAGKLHDEDCLQCRKDNGDEA